VPLQAIAAALNRQSATTRRDGRWWHQYVADLLRAQMPTGAREQAA
jgi:hypothetical protein